MRRHSKEANGKNSSVSEILKPNAMIQRNRLSEKLVLKGEASGRNSYSPVETILAMRTLP